MKAEQIEKLLQAQRTYFRTGATLDLSFRLDALDRLRAWILSHEDDIAQALRADLGKSPQESYMCETGMVLSELSHMLRHTRSYAAQRLVPTPMAQFPARSYVQPCPQGNVLIMSPWNYPFLLTLDPLVDAIAAGNTAILKPSAYAPATSALLEKMVADCFEPCHVALVTGGRQENQALLDLKFDMIFFTGGQTVGKEVLRHAAERLTPVVLELGGKSPCIVDETADLDVAARRIVFGKFLNCGQTCVAPDFLLCQESIRDRLLQAISREIEVQFGPDPLSNPDYGRIVTEKHFHRLLGLIQPEKTVHGGQSDAAALKIAPTVLRDVTPADPVMREEIFGPILPVLTYRNLEEVYDLLDTMSKPLALYLFSRDRDRIQRITTRIPYGGGCVNDVIIHLASTELGFGGVGESGMGAYHGRVGFDTFSHLKSIVDKGTWLDLPMRYQPYTNKLYTTLLRLFLK